MLDQEYVNDKLKDYINDLGNYYSEHTMFMDKTKYEEHKNLFYFLYVISVNFLIHDDLSEDDIISMENRLSETSDPREWFQICLEHGLFLDDNINYSLLPVVYLDY